jgi:hypothetical protein
MICQRLKNWGSLDFVQIYNYGIPFENVCGQLNKFKRDFKNDAGRARKGLGILKLSEKILKLKLIF